MSNPAVRLAPRALMPSIEMQLSSDVIYILNSTIIEYFSILSLRNLLHNISILRFKAHY